MKFRYIEMVGLSGVGKTTLISGDASPLRNDVIIMRPIIPSHISVIYHLLLLILKMIILSPVRGVHTILLREWRLLLLKLAYRIAGIKERERAVGYEVFLKDSGILMPIVSSIIDDKLDYNNYPLNKLLECLPLPSFVYYLRDPDCASVYKRFVARESIKMKDLSSYSVESFIEATGFINKMLLLLKDMNIVVKTIDVKL
jgi:hypothetical protein